MSKRTAAIVTLAPVLTLIFLFFIIPLFDSVDRSMHALDGTYVGFDLYAEVINSELFPRIIRNTLLISLASTAISLTLATVFALALRGQFFGKRVSAFVFQLNSAFPHMTAAIMMVFLLSTWGYISSLCFNIGIIEHFYDFPKLIKGDSWIGVIISFTWKFAPFIGLSVLSVLQSSTSEYEMQAATLGLGPIRRFVFVTLPSIAPALFSSGIICFAYAFGCYEVPALLSNQSTMSIYAYRLFNEPVYSDISNYSYVYSNMILIVSVVAAILYYFITVSKRRVNE